MPPSRRSTRAQSYRPRVLDVELDERAAEFAAIAIEGPKGVGKTETARRRANTEFLLDGPVGQIAKASPEMVVAGDPPILIDEWQRVPATWDVVRRAVDGGAAPGTFLLAGSASEHGTHSGAGRIINLRMRPMTLSERGVGTPTVSLRALLEKDRSTIAGQSEVMLEQYADEIVASGFPAARTLSTQAAEDFLESYTGRSGGASAVPKR
jgi:predicted AAA+ superfamily ATPase